MTTGEQRELEQDLMRRIVALAAPRRVILFGSAAHGVMGPDSDFDVLVIVEDGRNPKEATRAIYQGLWGFPLAVDALVFTEGDVERHGEDPGFVIRQALQEGRELFHAA